MHRGFCLTYTIVFKCFSVFLRLCLPAGVVANAVPAHAAFVTAIAHGYCRVGFAAGVAYFELRAGFAIIAGHGKPVVQPANVTRGLTSLAFKMLVHSCFRGEFRVSGFKTKDSVSAALISIFILNTYYSILIPLILFRVFSIHQDPALTTPCSGPRSWGLGFPGLRNC